MNTSRCGLLILVGLCVSGVVYANSAPVVSNVQAAQRNDDSKQVDIYYNLYDANGDSCTVWVAVSDNNGSTWSVPAMSFTGAVGKNIAPGLNKHIIWDAGRDMPGKIANFKVRVVADDGKGPIQMVPVPAGSFAYQNASSGGYVFVGAFMIAKYEVTNEHYIQFLNDYDPTSLHWDGAMGGEILRNGSAGNYYYTIVAGRNNYPVRWVSFNDATAFCTWLSAKTGQNYRLPTEQEWEKAAGWNPVLQKLWTYGYQTTAFNATWGNYNNYYGGPLPVGSFNGTGDKNLATSYYGCYDMSGNVWEWTNSWYTVNSSRVVRGGHWSINASSCAVTYRNYFTPSSRYNVIGFRFVLDF
jgi:formylglycine-generating enzyme required for sulfatase activity